MGHFILHKHRLNSGSRLSPALKSSSDCIRVVSATESDIHAGIVRRPDGLRGAITKDT
jgi:hypothetical protein